MSAAGMVMPKRRKVREGARMEEMPRAMRPRARVLMARVEEGGMDSGEGVGLGMRGVVGKGVLVEDIVVGRGCW